MLNKERPEVIDTLIESMMDVSLYSPNLYVLELFSKKMKVEFNSKREIEEWFNSEYVEPFKITQAEKCILEILQFSHYWIFKDGSEFKACYSIPADYKNFIKKETACVDLVTLPLFDGCFEWIKEDKKTYKISDILENCEVID